MVAAVVLLRLSSFLRTVTLMMEGLLFHSPDCVLPGGLVDRPWGFVAQRVCYLFAPSSSACVFPAPPSPFYVGFSPLIWTSRVRVLQSASDISPSPQ